MIYWLLKHIFLGPLLRLAYRPKAKGLQNVPLEGPVILASNHLSFVDSLFIPLLVKRKVVFLGKSDYFDSKKTRWFFRSVNVIPVRREGGVAGEASIQAGVQALREGNIVGIYPEGTRSRDGRLYRGRTGVGHLALTSGAPVVPVGLEGTQHLQPVGSRVPRLARVTVRFGQPLHFAGRYDGVPLGRARREVTDEVMSAIARLSGQVEAGVYNERGATGPAG